MLNIRDISQPVSHHHLLTLHPPLLQARTPLSSQSVLQDTTKLSMFRRNGKNKEKTTPLGVKYREAATFAQASIGLPWKRGTQVSAIYPSAQHQGRITHTRCLCSMLTLLYPSSF